MELEEDADAIVRKAMSIIGSKRTEKKAETSRENGKLGGRKAGSAQTEETKRKISESNKARAAEKRAATPVIVKEKRAPGRPRTRPLPPEGTPRRGRGRPPKASLPTPEIE